MQTTTSKDFFVSYNQHDRVWAEWIAWQVEACGYTVVIQAWDFRPGANFVLEMQTGLSAADRLILVLSNNFLKSDFTQPEWASMFADDPRGSENRLLPVRVGECEPTGLLKALVYVDLVGKDEETARADLISGLRRGRAKPSNSPRFPHSTSPHFPKTADEERVEPQALKSNSGRARFTLVFSGTIDSMDKPTVEAILEHVKQFSRDASVTLIETKPGSIRMTFEGSLAGINRLRQLIDSGGLNKIVGFVLESSDFEEAKASEETFIESLLTANMPKLRLLAKRVHAQWGGGDGTVTEGDLVNEACLQMLQRRPFWEINWTRFFENMAMNMHAVFMAQYAQKRGAGADVEKEILEIDEIVDKSSPLKFEDLFDCLDKLEAESPASAQVIKLNYIEGFTIDEIAKQLRTTSGHVLVLRQRGIVYLRKHLTTDS